VKKGSASARNAGRSGDQARPLLPVRTYSTLAN